MANKLSCRRDGSGAWDTGHGISLQYVGVACFRWEGREEGYCSARTMHLHYISNFETLAFGWMHRPYVIRTVAGFSPIDLCEICDSQAVTIKIRYCLLERDAVSFGNYQPKNK
jgi:hypothetical protein